MKAIICELCGGNDLIKQGDLFVCQHCGTKYELEAARKLLIGDKIDISGSSVKIDRSNENEKLLTLARRTKRESNYKQAEKYYTQLAINDPDNWEAAFYSTYCTLVSTTTKSNVQNSVKQLTNAVGNIVQLIHESVSDEDALYNVLFEISKDICSIAERFYVQMLIGIAEKHQLDSPKDMSFYDDQQIILNLSKNLINTLSEEIRKYFLGREKLEDIMLALRLTTALDGRGKENMWNIINNGIDRNIKSDFGEDIKCVRILRSELFCKVEAKGPEIQIYEKGIIILGERRRYYLYPEIAYCESKRKILSFTTQADYQTYEFKIKKGDVEACVKYINSKIG